MAGFVGHRRCFPTETGRPNRTAAAPAEIRAVAATARAARSAVVGGPVNGSVDAVTGGTDPPVMSGGFDVSVVDGVEGGVVDEVGGFGGVLEPGVGVVVAVIGGVVVVVVSPGVVDEVAGGDVVDVDEVGGPELVVVAVGHVAGLHSPENFQ